MIITDIRQLENWVIPENPDTIIITNIEILLHLPGIYLIYTPNLKRNPYTGMGMDLWERFNNDSDYKYFLNKNNTRPIIRALRKYGGLENCRIELVHWWTKPVDKWEVLNLETACIDFYDSLVEKGGYNICLFSNNRKGYKCSKQQIKNMSNGQKEKYDNGYIHPMKGKTQEKVKGEKNGMWGKTHTPEVCEKLRNYFKIKCLGKGNPRYDYTIYHFKNKITNEVFVGTRYDFIKKYNLRGSEICFLIHKKRKSTKKWILIENTN